MDTYTTWSIDFTLYTIEELKALADFVYNYDSSIAKHIYSYIENQEIKP